MSGFPEIKAAIEQTATAFEEFKKTNSQSVSALKTDHAALIERVEELESKRMTPGRTTGKPAPSTDVWRLEDGTVVPVLRKGMDFAAHYPAPSGGERDELTFGDFVRAVARLKTSDIAQKALSVGTDSAGGYAVPTVLMPGILEALTPASSMMLAGAGIVDVSQREAKAFNMAAVSTLPTAAWRSEGGAVPESDPALRLVAATPRSLAFYFKMSRELLMDAPDIDAALRLVIAQAFAKELDRTGLRGSGSAPEPRGILNTSGIQAVGNGTNGASLATTAYANFVSAVQALLAADAPMPTAAIMAPRSLTTLGGLLDTTNQPRQRPEMLRPMQFIATSQIPVNLTVGSSTDCSEIYLGDFTKVMFVMRETPSIMLANELFAVSAGQLAFICHVRADVVVQYPAAFSVVTGVRA